MRCLQGVSSRLRIESFLAFAIVVVSLFVASQASAASRIVVRGPPGSERADAIAAELRARGFVVTDGLDALRDVRATVDVESDGSVVVVAGERREPFPASDSDETLVRRIAETIRANVAEPRAPEPPAVPVAAPPPEPAPATQPAPAAEPPRLSRTPMAPARTFAAAGTWLLSVDEAVPLFAVGAPGPHVPGSVLRIGDPSFGASPSTKPPYLDVALFNRVTVGATVLAQMSERSALGGALRVGYMLPLSDRLALWSRLGLAHTSTSWALSSLLARTDLVLDVRLAWTVSDSWALTLGPTLAQAVHQSARQPKAFDSGDTPPGAVRNPGQTSFVQASTALGVSIGVTGQIASHSHEETGRPDPEPRVFLGVERVVPLFMIRGDSVAVGTADVAASGPQVPRFAIDGRVGRYLTVGIAGSIGFERASESTALVPGASAPETVSWAIAPRVGLRTMLSRAFGLWPRVGMSYAHASSTEGESGNEFSSVYHSAVDFDGFAVVYPVRGVGLLFGPSLEAPLAGARWDKDPARITATNRDGTSREEQTFFTFAVSGGLVLNLP